MKLIAFDLGTGGVKASLYDCHLNTLAKSFIEYGTAYPSANMHEQKPEDWWEGVLQSAGKLLSESGARPEDIGCLALSGHSLVAVPIDRQGNALLQSVPIWSDTRAENEAREFFQKTDAQDWYMTTGNGFPAPCYPIFKLMWMKKHQPEVAEKIYKVLGSKDYINYRLTGEIFTDFSYASGSGCYNLRKRGMERRFLEAAGLDASIFPEIVPSHRIVGRLTRKAAAAIGLCEGTPVACGGVDNACMALGAVGVGEGKTYVSLGSSSWIPVNSAEPVLDPVKKPYVFAHIEEGMYTSAFSIFSGGNSLRWVRDTLCKDLPAGGAAYAEMDRLAQKVPAGAHGILFNPSLAGGTSQDKSVNIRGAFLGLHLGTTREDIIRAAMEGIAFNLKLSLDFLTSRAAVAEPILFCGGGSKSPVWLQMFADIFGIRVVKTNVDQDAASIGAAAIAARAVGVWEDYGILDTLPHVERQFIPVPENAAKYRSLLRVFRHVCDVLADLGDYMSCAE